MTTKITAEDVELVRILKTPAPKLGNTDACKDVLEIWQLYRCRVRQTNVATAMGVSQAFVCKQMRGAKRNELSAAQAERLIGGIRAAARAMATSIQSGIVLQVQP